MINILEAEDVLCKAYEYDIGKRRFYYEANYFSEEVYNIRGYIKLETLEDRYNKTGKETGLCFFERSCCLVPAKI